MPALPKLYVSIHVGRSVHMDCERGGYKHSGLLVHGDIDIIPAGTSAIWEPHDKDTALTLGVDRRALAMAAQQAGMTPDRLEILNRFQIRDPQIENLGWAFKAEMQAGYPNGRIFTESLTAALATCLVRKHSARWRPAPDTGDGPSEGMGWRRLRQVLSYIEDNLEQDLSITNIALVAGMSTSHCKLRFRQSMGMPVHQYVIQRRVERAKSLLGEGKMPIAEIARETGFAHQSHLALHMRRIAGCSPKAIRNQGQ